MDNRYPMQRIRKARKTVSKMAEHWARIQACDELEECELDHWQEWLAADPDYELWCKLYETDMEELPRTGSEILEPGKPQIAQ